MPCSARLLAFLALLCPAVLACDSDTDAVLELINLCVSALLNHALLPTFLSFVLLGLPAFDQAAFSCPRAGQHVCDCPCPWSCYCNFLGWALSGLRAFLGRLVHCMGLANMCVSALPLVLLL